MLKKCKPNPSFKSLSNTKHIKFSSTSFNCRTLLSNSHIYITLSFSLVGCEAHSQGLPQEEERSRPNGILHDSSVQGICKGRNRKTPPVDSILGRENTQLQLFILFLINRSTPTKTYLNCIFILLHTVYVPSFQTCQTG